MSAYSSNRRGGRAGNRAGALALIGLIGMSMAQGAVAKPARTFWTSRP